MVEVQLFDRLRAVAQRKRWTIGLAVSRGCRLLDVALVGTEGIGLSGRAETFAYRRQQLPGELRHLFVRLARGASRSPADAALLAAQLAESQAALLDEFAAEVAPVWDRVLAVAVDDRGLWHDARGLALWVGLCDAARLADLSGHNVIDAFAARDLAQDGRGRPLLPLPYWMLLHHPQEDRLLVECGRRTRLTYLPASRDLSGAARLAHVVLPAADSSHSDAAGTAQAVARCLATGFPQLAPVDALVLAGPAEHAGCLRAALSPLLPSMPVLGAVGPGMPAASLRAAGLALLGLLHLDHVPANVTAITGARTPRVLGRLTPGSLANWHRLLRELASARPSVVALRSAV
jgi:1,6-anhydro-N-acetylmuramate kinase